jgi:hypothetical protein
LIQSIAKSETQKCMTVSAFLERHHMGNRAKSLFDSVLFNKFHHGTKLMAFSSAILIKKNNYVKS